jgi:hypothetical protein
MQTCNISVWLYWVPKIKSLLFKTTCLNSVISRFDLIKMNRAMGPKKLQYIQNQKQCFWNWTDHQLVHGSLTQLVVTKFIIFKYYKTKFGKLVVRSGGMPWQPRASFWGWVRVRSLFNMVTSHSRIFFPLAKKWVKNVLQKHKNQF